MKEKKSLLSDVTNEHVYHCAKCGLCLDACPVYREMLMESHSPRGKVQLAKHIIEGDTELTEHMHDILFSSCLLCGSCVAACPSGVRQDALFSGLRWRAAERYGLGFAKKLFFQVLARGWLMSTSAWFGKWVRKIFGGPWIESKMKAGNLPIDGIPPMNPKPFNDEFPEIVRPEGTVNAHVLYFHGCATNYVFGDVGKAVVSVLTRMGVQVEIPKKQSCCGLPIFLSGDRKTALACIREVVGMFSRKDVDAIIVDCATCGSALRNEYVHILKELRDLGEGVDDDLVKSAEYLADKTMDVSEFIDAHRDWLPVFRPFDGDKIRVTYHDPCHLVKGQKVGVQPRRLLKLLPAVEFVEMEEADRCCGGGGEYQIEYGDMSARITNRKVENVLKTGAGIVATGCPGCTITIGAHLAKDNVRTVHTVQLIKMAMDESGPGKSPTM
ncbi:MAG TPA: (Fe-S)-binding protein [Syntrophales bacterium]|nr:(Fe-S)-binding protein [Syntrophales bacterium]